MDTIGSARATRWLVLTVILLGSGCVADVTSDAPDTPTADVEDLPTTHPLDLPSESALRQAVLRQGASDEAAGREPLAQVSGRSDECGAVPASLVADRSGKRSGSSGSSEYWASAPNYFTALHTKLTVPPKPPATGTLFLWPGLQPLGSSKNFAPIGNGVLQPVLTWGPTCAPNAPARSYDSWWISAVYVNVTTSLPAYRDCHGGPGMNVNVGDVLDITMTLEGTAWKQQVKNLSNGRSVSYSLDLRGQDQMRAIFDIELVSRTKPVSDVVFTETSLTYAQPVRSCAPSAQGANDFIARARISPDGKKCCIDKITLRASGVSATTSP